jgi:nucleotide-binding universal stress UspA family protein
MEKKVLIAVDESVGTNHTLDYAARISFVIKELRHTLMHVQPPISQYFIEEAKDNPKLFNELTMVRRKNQRAAEELLSNCRDRLIRRGIEAERIDLFTYPCKLGVAGDVIEKAQHGTYDAILVSRRALTRTQQLFMGSVSSQILCNSPQIPVWIVDGEVSSMKILVAVEGSARSLRSVDHLAFMIGGNPEVEVVLFHVTPKLRDYCTLDFKEEQAPALELAFLENDRQCIDKFHAQAQAIFEEAGLTKKQIITKIKTTLWDTARAIRDETRRGKYGTVVLGRSGLQKSFFIGSVSSKVIQSLNNCALWVTP